MRIQKCWQNVKVDPRREVVMRKVRMLGELVQRWNPKIFLLETKIKKKAMEKIMEKINFVNGLIVPRKGREEV